MLDKMRTAELIPLKIINFVRKGCEIIEGEGGERECQMKGISQAGRE